MRKEREREREREREKERERERERELCNVLLNELVSPKGAFTYYGIIYLIIKRAFRGQMLSECALMLKSKDFIFMPGDCFYFTLDKRA